MSKASDPEQQAIEIPTITDSLAIFGVETATIWQSSTLAPEWYNDAVRETGMDGPAARRREILFAVCAAESYYFEWVRDVILNSNFERLSHYFPTDKKKGKKRGVLEKFKEMTKQLKDDDCIAGTLDCSGREYQAFVRLVDFRDGLVHAMASRPSTANLSKESRPVPSQTDLDTLPAGWAIGVVWTILEKLHHDTRTPRAGWFGSLYGGAPSPAGKLPPKESR